VTPEAALTAAEQAAFDNLVRWFPGTTVGALEPHTPESRQHCEKLLAEQTRLAEEAKPTILGEADQALAEDTQRSTWRAIDLRDHLDPDQDEDGPTLLVRTDGVACIYQGRRNELHGSFETGKSWLGKVLSLEVIRGGGTVVWLDLEDSARSVVRRMLALGATPEELLRLFRYIQPGERLTPATEIDLRLELHDASLVVIDAANEAMALAGFDPNKNVDVAGWYSTVPRLATDAGATVLVLDHVAKDPAAQRGAVGAGHKIAAIDGASYRVDAVTPFGRGSIGLVRLRLTKDRPGYVRGLLGPGREPVAAEVHFDATDPAALVVEVRPPAGGEGESWKPTRLMQKISRHLEGASEPVSMRELLRAVPGKRDYLIEALEALVEGGYVGREKGPRNASLHVSLRPFREEER
jgi:hypothetical protein